LFVVVGAYLHKAPVRPVRGHQCNRSFTAYALSVGLLTADVAVTG